MIVPETDIHRITVEIKRLQITLRPSIMNRGPNHKGSCKRLIVGFQYRSQVLNPFQRILIVCFYCVLSHNCPSLGRDERSPTG